MEKQKQDFNSRKRSFQRFLVSSSAIPNQPGHSRQVAAEAFIAEQNNE